MWQGENVYGIFVMHLRVVCLILCPIFVRWNLKTPKKLKNFLKTRIFPSLRLHYEKVATDKMRVIILHCLTINKLTHKHGYLVRTYWHD